ncbi:DUF4829 domain-containing protein [Romboutsia sedimentorum]|uniref:DUF4829 domain-containing protein n=1 Tax=Romboutsia sedimentorum TaxID=1368474 RepID=UPI0024DE25CE|nr:DUF4829 domain-containing protein [Romboutsia sedimentorum]MDK2584616.1 DUF4829 domain-containing protein [Romboutsia sedimentorum]
MKKVISSFIIILIVFSVVGCNRMGKTKDASITIGKSVKFSKKEIDDAVECVKERFKNYKGCTLTDLWYDENKSNTYVEDYLKYGGGTENGSTKENSIVLMSNFDVDSLGGDGSFEPNSTTDDWQWVLIRDSKTSKWEVIESGY